MKKKSLADSAREVQAICYQCAKNAGGYMLDGEVNTISIGGRCGICGEITATTPPSDFHWPDKKGYIFD